MSFVQRSSSSNLYLQPFRGFVCFDCRAKIQSNLTRSFKDIRARAIHISTNKSRSRPSTRQHVSILPSGSPSKQQRRWITRNHMRHITEAESDWAKRAADIQAGHKQSVLDLLEERGYVNQLVGNRDDLKVLLDNRRVGVYAGIDPTAASMHVGHMVPFMALSWLYVHGYPVTFLLGGSTARVGDPEGRLAPREETMRAKRVEYMASMHAQLKRFGSSMERYAEKRGMIREWAWKRALRNNNAWMHKTSIMEFIKVMGNQVRLGPMLGRDTVKNRMEKGTGMSVAEFVYPLMQAWDWWQLYQTGTQVQIGGADQFGNILAGAGAVKNVIQTDFEWNQKVTQEEAVLKEVTKGEIKPSDDPMGFTVPLLTTSAGEKFGKSAGNAVWLDPNMTSEFELYQFWLRTADADVERYLKFFTFLPMPEIQMLMNQHTEDQSKRIPQHKLASEFVELIHGPKAAAIAEEQSRKAYDKNLTVEDIQAMVAEQKAEAAALEAERQQVTVKGQPKDLHPKLFAKAQPLLMHANTANTHINLPRSLVIGQSFPKVLYSAGLTNTRSEGHRLVLARGAYIGGQKGDNKTVTDSLTYVAILDPKWDEWKQYMIDGGKEDGVGNLLILRTGKWKVKFVTVISDEDFRASGATAPGWEELEAGENQERESVVENEAEEAKKEVSLNDFADNETQKFGRSKQDVKTTIERSPSKALYDDDDGVLPQKKWQGNHDSRSNDDRQPARRDTRAKFNNSSDPHPFGRGEREGRSFSDRSSFSPRNNYNGDNPRFASGENNTFDKPRSPNRDNYSTDRPRFSDRNNHSSDRRQFSNRDSNNGSDGGKHPLFATRGKATTDQPQFSTEDSKGTDRPRFPSRDSNPTNRPRFSSRDNNSSDDLQPLIRKGSNYSDSPSFSPREDNSNPSDRPRFSPRGDISNESSSSNLSDRPRYPSRGDNGRNSGSNYDRPRSPPRDVYESSSSRDYSSSKPRQEWGSREKSRDQYRSSGWKGRD